jgi:hypothetical protein
MELEGKGQVEGLWADRTVGLDNAFGIFGGVDARRSD